MHTMVRAIAKQAEAERDRRANVEACDRLAEEHDDARARGEQMPAAKEHDAGNDKSKCAKDEAADNRCPGIHSCGPWGGVPSSRPRCMKARTVG